MRVYEFDEEWVWAEWIDGILLSNKDQYIQSSNGRFESRARNSGCWIDQSEVDWAAIQDAVKHLHRIGVAHTDIAGFNIMVDRCGVPKLIDLIGAMPLNEELRSLDERRLGEVAIELRKGHAYGP